MKKTFRLASSVLAAAVLLLGTAASCPAAETTKNEQKAGEGKHAEIKFTEKTHNFGIVKEDGGPIKCSFEFTNTGDAPLVILSATASCGCTRPTFPTDPIAPGKKGKIQVTYLPEGRPGEFTKIVKVRTNAKESKKINLTIKGSVRPK